MDTKKQSSLAKDVLSTSPQNGTPKTTVPRQIFGVLALALAESRNSGFSQLDYPHDKRCEDAH